MSSMKTLSGENRQRVKQQFPIEKDVCYHSMRRGRVSASGVGKTLQISSHEVHFTTDAPLKQGERVLLAVDWPALLDNACLMKLEICGSVIRSFPEKPRSGSRATNSVRVEPLSELCIPWRVRRGAFSKSLLQ